MKLTIHPAILEATRLTREGQLIEATVLLQNMLLSPGEWPHATTSSSATSGDSQRAPEASPMQEEPEKVEASRALVVAGPEANRALATVTPQRRRRKLRLPNALRSVINGFRKARAKSSDQTFLDQPPPEHWVRPKHGRFLTATFAGHDGARTYKLYVPSAYHGQPLPLIVMLHGCTQNADDFATGTRMNLIAEEKSCFVAYPVQPKSANGSKCWNWFSPRHQHRGRGEPSLIAGITRQIMRDYAIDRKRVYIAGLSAGGASAVILGATYPDIYAAVGVHSGLARGAATNVPSAFSVMRHGCTTIPNTLPLTPGPAGDRPLVPTIVFHGDEDKTVHPRNGEQVIEQLRMKVATDFRLETECGQEKAGHSYTRTNYLDGKGPAVLELWVVHKCGHAWSGGCPDGTYTDPHGPDASREMVRFFFEHPHVDAV